MIVIFRRFELNFKTLILLFAVAGLMIPTPFMSVIHEAKAQDDGSFVETQLHVAEKFAGEFLIDPLSAVSWLWNIADWADARYDRLLSAIGSELPLLEQKTLDCVNYSLEVLKLESEGKDHFDPVLLDADEKLATCLFDLYNESSNFADSDDTIFWQYVIVMHWALEGNDVGLEISGIKEFEKDFQDFTGIDAEKIERNIIAVEAAVAWAILKYSSGEGEEEAAAEAESKAAKEAEKTAFQKAKDGAKKVKKVYDKEEAARGMISDLKTIMSEVPEPEYVGEIRQTIEDFKKCFTQAPTLAHIEECINNLEKDFAALAKPFIDAYNGIKNCTDDPEICLKKAEEAFAPAISNLENKVTQAESFVVDKVTQCTGEGKDFDTCAKGLGIDQETIDKIHECTESTSNAESCVEQFEAELEDSVSNVVNDVKNKVNECLASEKNAEDCALEVGISPVMVAKIEQCTSSKDALTGCEKQLANSLIVTADSIGKTVEHGLEIAGDAIADEASQVEQDVEEGAKKAGEAIEECIDDTEQCEKDIEKDIEKDVKDLGKAIDAAFGSCPLGYNTQIGPDCIFEAGFSCASGDLIGNQCSKLSSFSCDSDSLGLPVNCGAKCDSGWTEIAGTCWHDAWFAQSCPCCTCRSKRRPSFRNLFCSSWRL